MKVGGIVRMLALGVVGFCGAVAPVCAADGVRAEAAEGISLSLRKTAMPLMDDSRLGRTLNRYYQRGLGGPESWARIESLRVAGRMSMVSGDLEFKGYHKKPDCVKMVMRRPQRELVLGYDGLVAWKVLPDNGGRAEVMGAAEGRSFAHGAAFGNHLLYPYAPGKQLAYIDTVPVAGAICHQVQVTLEAGYRVDYFIDVQSYRLVKSIHKDLRTDVLRSFSYQDYVLQAGMPVARRVVGEVAGEWASTLVLDEVKVNAGLMSWMFKMPK